MRTQPNIPGARDIVTIFGEWPDFHDSEILRVCIRRDSRSEIDIHWLKWVIRPGAAKATLENEAVVQFSFEAVTRCELGGEEVNVQNVLMSAAIEDMGSGTHR